MKPKTLLSLTLLSALAAQSPSARACGGCFAPPAENSTVTGHRMAFAVSENRTVLWDKFEYSGSPTDFSWVLPVAPGAYLEASTDAWFETLEQRTQARVTASSLTCGQPSSSSSCGLGAAAVGSDDSSGAYVDRRVRVLHRGTVGPYETVTLRSTDGSELQDWLTMHGYVVPADIESIIDEYVDEGADFIALRLAPDKGVNEMTPVRVVTPHGDPILPLRMVQAGTGASVDIVLYVIAESRQAMPDLPEATLDVSSLTWDWDANESNYAQVRDEALETNDAHTFLTTFAQEGALGSANRNGSMISYVVDDQFFFSTFAEAYFAQAQANDDVGVNGCPGLRSLFDDERRVVAEASSTEELDAAKLECDGYSDLSAAFIGMRPNRVWLTRLELNLPREALSMDCAVQPHEDQTAVSNSLTAPRHANPPCEPSIFASRVAKAKPTAGTTAAGLAGLFLAAAFWRRRRRSTES